MGLVRRWFMRLVVGVAALSVASTAHAQRLGLPLEAAGALGGSATTAQQLLADGAELERQERWRDALHHYEAGLKQTPDDPQLEQRLTLVRTHLEIGRRYSDSSYSQSLRSLTDYQALDLYSEVLVKVQSHYVEQPDWARLVDFGAYHLQVALLDQQFLQFHPQTAQVAPERRSQIARDLRKRLQERTIADRLGAREAAWYASQIAQQQLAIPASSTILEFLCGATNALDPYSSFLTAAELKDVYSQIDGNFVGLGVELKTEKQSLLIVDVIEGGPAAEAGIRRGDRVVEVDRANLRDINPDKAADMLRGPAGSQVDLMIVSSLGSARRLKLTRRQVDVPSVVNIKMLEPAEGIGYLRLTSFQKSTSDDVDKALWKLHGLGMRSLVMDLRGNPGGLLTAAVEVADKFVDQGPLVSTRGRSPREDFDYQARPFGTWRVPLIVLIDHDSASASEIFAGAIHDHRRGVIVGERSYGKGSVQGIFELNLSQSGIRLTTARFFSPSGTPISKRGVTPDITVQAHATARVPTAEATLTFPGDDPQADPVVQAAIQAARKNLSQR